MYNNDKANNKRGIPWTTNKLEIMNEKGWKGKEIYLESISSNSFSPKYKYKKYIFEIYPFDSNCL